MRRSFSAAEKAKWADEREAKVAQAKELLADGVRALQTSEQWKAMLERIAKNARVRFRVSRYSFGNQLLVWTQAPHARATAGYKQWQAAGRNVRKGEKGILIRQPRPWVRTERDDQGNENEERGMAFGAAFVFDVSQTDGKELEAPPPLLCETLDPAAVFASGHARLRDVALGLDGAPVTSVDVRIREPGDPGGAAGWYVRSTKAIVVIDNGNPAEMFATLAHEIGHAILHGAGERHETRQQEVEAESVAFIVAHAVGLDTRKASFPYVAMWAGREDAAKRILESGERITRAANKILAALFDEGAGESGAEDKAA